MVDRTVVENVGGAKIKLCLVLGQNGWPGLERFAKPRRARHGPS